MSLKNSASYLTHSEILIWDNSPIKQDSSLVSEFFQNTQVEFSYEHHPENLELSKVYNTIIECYKYFSYDYMFILDHDSSFTFNYFKEVETNYALDKSLDLFLPIIQYKNRIVSPTRKYFIKGFYFKRKPYGVNIAKNISAINSGMVISFKYLKKYSFKYDERLSFYGTDDYFMMKFCENKGKVFFLDYKMEHDLTLSTLNTNSIQLQNSYHKMLQAWEIIYADSIFSSIVSLYATLHSIYTAIKYRDKGFLKWR